MNFQKNGRVEGVERKYQKCDRETPGSDPDREPIMGREMKVLYRENTG